jgi:hypothetical protein
LYVSPLTLRNSIPRGGGVLGVTNPKLGRRLFSVEWNPRLSSIASRGFYGDFPLSSRPCLRTWAVDEPKNKSSDRRQATRLFCSDRTRWRSMELCWKSRTRELLSLFEPDGVNGSSMPSNACIQYELLLPVLLGVSTEASAR